jgi:hypothetical protein
MRAMFEPQLSSPASEAREGDPGGPLRLNFSKKIRHRPACPGDPIFFRLKNKMGCPDKPGNDEFVFLRADKLNHLVPLPSLRCATLTGDDSFL